METALGIACKIQAEEFFLLQQRMDAAWAMRVGYTKDAFYRTGKLEGDTA